ncbi:MAG: TetR/AcrR family transcriptional regulator [Roseiarcus sp.]
MPQDIATFQSRQAKSNKKMRRSTSSASSSATDTRQLLLEAALQCFAERGYDGAGIRMIAERAGCSLSLISHYFGSKERLYVETYRFLFQRSDFGKLMSSSPTSTPRNRADAISHLRESIHLIYSLTSQLSHSTDPIQIANRNLWIRELRAPRAEVIDLYKTMLTPWKDQIHRSISFLRSDLTEAEIDFLGSSILLQALVQGVTLGISEVLWGPNRLSQFKSAELITEFVLNGLGVREHQE